MVAATVRLAHWTVAAQPLLTPCPVPPPLLDRQTMLVSEFFL